MDDFEREQEAARAEERGAPRAPDSDTGAPQTKEEGARAARSAKAGVCAVKKEGRDAPPRAEQDIDEASLRYRGAGDAARGGLLGFFIGIAIIVPGVSGSTIAILFRLYEKLLYALGNILKKFRACVRFLLPIALGIGLGFALGFFAVRALLERAPFSVICLFAGLMTGAWPSLFAQVRGVPRSAGNAGLFLLGILLPVAACLITLFVAPPQRALEGVQWYSLFAFLLLGALVALTQLVPGLSATALLMMAGYFKPLLDSVSLSYWRENPAVFAVYAALALGFVGGLFACSKALSRLFERQKQRSFVCILGLSLASIATLFFNAETLAVYRAWAQGQAFALDLCLGVFLFVLGIAVGAAFVRIEQRRANKIG